eukprot:m.6945 g.6945  ORF g.6945 m.6945 type:complete len:67 (-) comp4503_c0_seq1:255-455(-)
MPWMLQHDIQEHGHSASQVASVETQTLSSYTKQILSFAYVVRSDECLSNVQCDWARQAIQSAAHIK